MVQNIDKRRHLFLQWRVDSGAIAPADSLHRHAWFSVGDLNTAVTSRTGGRQGCKLGALTFNSAYGIGLDILQGNEPVEHIFESASAAKRLPETP